MCNMIETRVELYEQLRKELPVLRARLGVTQENLAMMVGCSRQTMNSIENGKKEMTWQLFMAIIAVFNREESTRKMLNDLPDFDEKLNIVLSEEIFR